MVAVVLAGVVLGFGAQARADEQRFFSNISDLPLMNGLYELPDSAVVFDKEDGRIVESSAAGDGVAPERIMAFYRATLPQLGWKPVGQGAVYERGGETLQLKAENDAGVGVLRVLLAPKEGAGR